MHTPAMRRRAKAGGSDTAIEAVELPSTGNKVLDGKGSKNSTLASESDVMPAPRPTNSKLANKKSLVSRGEKSLNEKATPPARGVASKIPKTVNSAKRSLVNVDVSKLTIDVSNKISKPNVSKLSKLDASRLTSIRSPSLIALSDTTTSIRLALAWQLIQRMSMANIFFISFPFNAASVMLRSFHECII